MRSFLGLVGYYRDHIPAFAEISAPLTDLLKKGKAEHIQWREAQERAYSLLKEYLLQEPVLKLPDLSKPFVLRTDASGVGVAAVLLQENDGKLYPVGYASKKLNLTEARYPIIEKECLAVQEVQALLGWEKIYSPDRPQALEVPKGRVVPERPSVPVGRSGTRVLL